jgi:hypothetical protein
MSVLSRPPTATTSPEARQRMRSLAPVSQGALTVRRVSSVVGRVSIASVLPTPIRSRDVARGRGGGQYRQGKRRCRPAGSANRAGALAPATLVANQLSASLSQPAIPIAPVPSRSNRLDRYPTGNQGHY